MPTSSPVPPSPSRAPSPAATPSMSENVPLQMTAIAIQTFGGSENLKPQSVEVPTPGEGQILVRVHTAGVGAWDKFEREGMFAQFYGSEPKFPYVLGSEGSGTVVALGPKVN